jgi:PGF-pre-PGF domain-containing protein
METPSIRPGDPWEVAVEHPNITRLTINTNKLAENVRIMTQQLTNRPVPTENGAFGTAYKYFNIAADNLSDAQIENVVIQFRVEKSWIAEKGINMHTITLNRFDPAENWMSLPTTFLSEDNAYAYFSAVSPGLSVYEISGQALTTTTTTTSPATIPPTITPPTTTTTVPTTTATTTAPPTTTSPTTTVVIFGFVAGVTIVLSRARAKNRKQPTRTFKKHEKNVSPVS